MSGSSVGQSNGRDAKTRVEGSAELAAAITHLDSLAFGWDCAALCEDAIVARFQDELDGFSARDAEQFDLRHVRAAVDARTNAASYRKDAAAVRRVLAALSSEPPPSACEQREQCTPATDAKS